MEDNWGIIIGRIGAVCTAGVLCMSYVGAYLLGRSRGRREVELREGMEDRGEARELDHDRMLMVESAVTTMAQAIERLTDVQRVALLERMRGANEPRSASGRPPQHNTPA